MISERFSRQTIISEIGLQGQETLNKSTILIVGLGALGSVQAELLTRAGIGKLILIDPDVVEESNLQRQALYTTKDIGVPKVKAAKKHLEEIWPQIQVQELQAYISLQNIHILEEADLVLDATDNMHTRFLLNEYCKKNKIPIIFTSAILDNGTIQTVFDHKQACYNCLYENKESFEDCQTTGVYNATTHLAATISSHEAIKHLLHLETLKGVLSFNLSNNRFDTFETSKRNTCKVCQGTYNKLTSKEAFNIRYCSRVQGMRADPLNKKATKNVQEIQGQQVLVDKQGAIFFSGLKDADKAKKLAEELI